MNKWQSRSIADMVTQGVLVVMLLFVVLNALEVDIAPLFVPVMIVLGCLAILVFLAVLVEVD